MMFPQDPKERKAAIIAACLTFIFALVVTVLLFVLSIGGDRREMAEASMPEVQDNEEIFIEPEFLDPELLDVDHLDSDMGGDDGEAADEEPAPQPEGEPEPADVKQDIRSEANKEKPKEKPRDEAKPAKPAVQAQPTPTQSDAKVSEPAYSGQEAKKIQDKAKDSFNKPNGTSTGKDSNVSGAGGEGLAVSYSGVGGRKMESYDKATFSTSSTVTVKVKIKVNAEGKVVGTPTIQSGGNKDQRAACIKMAKSSRWTPQPGADDVEGIITFTLTSK